MAEAVTRTVRARAINPRFIEGQLRHGPRGAAEFAETVDRLVGFAETTHAISGDLIEAVHDAYLGDERVRDFILDQKPRPPPALSPSGCCRRAGAGCGTPLRNSIDVDLNALIAQAPGIGGGVMDKRGACPTLREPMLTGDGLLVRLSPRRDGHGARAILRHWRGQRPVSAAAFWKSPAAAICRSGG